MRMVGQVEVSEAAYMVGCFRCPNCGDTKFGSTTMPDGSLIRGCQSEGNVEACTFRWPSCDDHLHFYLPLGFVLSVVSEV